MANQLYIPFLDGLLTGVFNMTTDDIRYILVDTGTYTHSSAHQFLTSVPAGARISVSATVTGLTASGGVWDHNSFVFPSVSGVTAEALIVYRHTGVDATSRLVAFIDTMAGLPVLPNGTNINVAIPTFVFQLAGSCP